LNVSKANEENVIRDRATRLFTYLKELALLKTKPTRDLSGYDAVVWFHEIPEHKGCLSILSSQTVESQDGLWLEVRRSKEPQRPPIPTSCGAWLDKGPDGDHLAEPRLKDSIPRSPEHNSSPDLWSHSASPSAQVEQLADHPDIVGDWENYLKNAWQPWAEVYRPWKSANDLYFQLFSIHEQLKKLGERYELLLGLGLLTWETPDNQIIKRHLVVGDAYLTFDADRAKFSLQGAPEGIRLRFETDMVDPNDLPSLEQQREIDTLLTSIEESPWDKDDLVS